MFAHVNVSSSCAVLSWQLWKQRQTIEISSSAHITNQNYRQNVSKPSKNHQKTIRRINYCGAFGFPNLWIYLDVHPRCNKHVITLSWPHHSHIRIISWIQWQHHVFTFSSHFLAMVVYRIFPIDPYSNILELSKSHRGMPHKTLPSSWGKNRLGSSGLGPMTSATSSPIMP